MQEIKPYKQDSIMGVCVLCSRKVSAQDNMHFNVTSVIYGNMECAIRESIFPFLFRSYETGFRSPEELNAGSISVGTNTRKARGQSECGKNYGPSNIWNRSLCEDVFTDWNCVKTD